MLVAACELVGTVDGSVPVVHESGNLAFGTLLVAAIAIEVVLWRRHGGTRTDLRWGGGAVAAMLVAFVIWNLAQGPWCDPTSWSRARRVAPAGRAGGVPAVPAVRQRAGPIPDRLHCQVFGQTAAYDADRRPRLRLLDRRLGRVRAAGQAGRPELDHQHVRRQRGDAPRALARQRRHRGAQHQRLRRRPRLLAPDLDGLDRRDAAPRRRDAGRRHGPRGAGTRDEDPSRIDVQRITWTQEGDEVRQVWETSTDDGATWTVAFDGRYRRRVSTSG